MKKVATTGKVCTVGRLKCFVSAWQNFGADRDIISWVKGFHILFTRTPFRTVLSLIFFNSFLASIDLVDAYLTVPIAQEHTKFLRFRFESVLYEFVVLLFGLSIGPWLFAKLMRPVVAHLRAQEYLSVLYLMIYCYLESRLKIV